MQCTSLRKPAFEALCSLLLLFSLSCSLSLSLSLCVCVPVVLTARFPISCGCFDIPCSRYFEQGRAPGDTDALADAAADAGLDRAETATFLATDDLRAEVVDEAARVRAAYGVTGVPFFVVHAEGSEALPLAVSGAQDPETLVKVSVCPFDPPYYYNLCIERTIVLFLYSYVHA